MANRVLRDWTTSDRMDKLSPQAECFFTRLIMKADDFGCFHANPKLLRAALFPLKDYTDKQIQSWLTECKVVGVLRTYESDGREYLQIDAFGQRLRAMSSKFPQPVSGPPPIVSDKPPETKGREEKVNIETNGSKITELGTGKYFVLVLPKNPNDQKFKIAGQAGMVQFFEMNNSMIVGHQMPFVEKYLRDNPGKHLNDFKHLWNDFTGYVNRAHQ